MGAAIALPLVRKRLRIPGPVTLAVSASGPLAVAVLAPRSRNRDVALFAMQMWAFTVVHEMPYDDPEKLRRRLYTRYPIEIDTRIGLGRLPGARLQTLLASRRGAAALDRFLTITHWLWFFEPYAILAWILVRHPEHFPRAARQMAAVFDAGAFGYWAMPTAPPWWAAEEGLTKEPMRRIMFEVGKPLWGRAWGRLYAALGGNPWAAMPSLHFATSVQGAISLSEVSRGGGRGRLGLRADPRLRPRLPRRALRHRPARRGRAGGRGAARRPRLYPRGRAGQQSDPAARADRRRAAPVASPSVPDDTGSDEKIDRGGLNGLPLLSTRRLLQTGVIVVILLVGIYFLFPKLVGLGDSLDKLGEADPVWIGVAIVFSIASYATYIALFKAVVGGDAVKFTWGETYEINMAGVAASLLLSAGGAGGVALTYWALKKAGVGGRDAARRMIALVSLHSLSIRWR